MLELFLTSLEEQLGLIINPPLAPIARMNIISLELTAYNQSNSDMKLIIQQFQNLLMVNTTTDALAKTAILMREETEAERLLSKALGHLRTCSDPEGDDLYDEIAAAFGE